MKYDYSQLLFDIQKKSNITISNVRDVKFLKEEIESVTNTSIAFNTLRRMFGFLEKREPNVGTLNKLANYLGYSSFSNYKNHKNNYHDWYFQQYLLLICKYNKLDISHIKEINKGISNENNVVYLGYFINFHIEKNNINSVKFIFQNVNFNQVSATQLHKLGIIISLILASSTEQKALKIYKTLIPFDNFRNYVPLLHIDYAHLATRYFDILQLIEKNNANPSDLLFSSLMYKYRDFYVLNKDIDEDINKPEDFESYHYTLKGRYYGYKLLQNNHQLEEVKKEIAEACTKNKVSFFLIEIIPALIYIEEIKLLEKLLNKYYEEVFEGEVWSSETTNAIYLIGLANVNLHNNKSQIAKRNLELIELDKVEIGYYHYINLFYNLTYLKISHAEKDKKRNKTAATALKKCIAITSFIRFESKLNDYLLRR